MPVCCVVSDNGSVYIYILHLHFTFYIFVLYSRQPLIFYRHNPLPAMANQSTVVCDDPKPTAYEALHKEYIAQRVELNATHREINQADASIYDRYPGFRKHPTHVKRVEKLMEQQEKSNDAIRTLSARLQQYMDRAAACTCQPKRAAPTKLESPAKKAKRAPELPTAVMHIATEYIPTFAEFLASGKIGMACTTSEGTVAVCNGTFADWSITPDAADCTHTTLVTFKKVTIGKDQTLDKVNFTIDHFVDWNSATAKQRATPLLGQWGPAVVDH